MLTPPTKRNHDYYKIEKERDLYFMQRAIFDKASDSKVKWVAQELANNILEYNEKGAILMNGSLVIAKIKLNSITKDSIDIIKKAICSIESSDNLMNVEQKTKNNYTYGGLGLLSIHKMGFKYRYFITKDFFIIACKLPKKH